MICDKITMIFWKMQDFFKMEWIVWENVMPFS